MLLPFVVITFWYVLLYSYSCWINSTKIFSLICRSVLCSRWRSRERFFWVSYSEVIFTERSALFLLPFVLFMVEAEACGGRVVCSPVSCTEDYIFGCGQNAERGKAKIANSTRPALAKEAKLFAQSDTENKHKANCTPIRKKKETKYDCVPAFISTILKYVSPWTNHKNIQ